MVTQASADASLCVIVEEAAADRALAALENAFERELQKGLLAGISIEKDHSVIAIVGEGMAFRPGTGAVFTKAMANSGVNIRTIAQGSSERQISICVEKEDCTKALRAAHAALALSNTQLSIAVIGATGMVGHEFLEQIVESNRVVDAPQTAGARKALDELALDFKVTALAAQQNMRLSYNGIGGVDCTSRDAVRELIAEDGSEEVQKTDLEVLTRFLNEDFNGNRVVIDCTASQEVAQFYPRWLALGIHVVSASKKAGSGDLSLYNECKRLAKSNAQWFYETTGPGSGLPVLSTLKDMTQSGDRVTRVSGIWSGSISFILNGLKEGLPLSEALKAAVEEGLCEPDPREDLSGLDVRRKTVVLARELGLAITMDDIQIEETLLPAALARWSPSGTAPVAEQLIEAIKPYDAEISERIAALSADGMTPVQLSVVDIAAGTATIGLTAVDTESRTARCSANENIVEIESKRYSASPMVLQGPGAGAQITASGLFADVLALSRTLVDWTIPSFNEE